MFLRRLLKRQIPVRSRVWGVALLFCILLISGCRGEEAADSNPLVETVGDAAFNTAAPAYFPMTVGSRWFYRNPDGFEWTREVTETEEVGSHLYHFFGYDSFINDNQSDLSESPMYSPTPYVQTFDGRLTYEIKLSDLNDAVQQTIFDSGRVSPDHWSLGVSCRTEGERAVAECRMRRRESIFRDGQWRIEINDDALMCLSKYDARVVWNSELTALRFPLVPYRRWKAIEARLSGTRYIPPLWDWEGVGYTHSFEADVTISGSAGQPETIVTPAGAFANCLKIQYEMTRLSFETTEFNTGWVVFEQRKLDLYETELRKELTTLFRDGLPRMQLGAVWLAPDIGPVKIETPNGIAELIDYEIKTVTSSQ